MESITGRDLTYLEIDCKEMPMNQGGVYFFQCTSKATPAIDEFRHLTKAGLPEHLCLRQRVINPMLRLANPIWLEDPHFDINHQVTQIELPKHAKPSDLLRKCAELFAQQFDRASPLWRLYLVPLSNASELFNADFGIITLVHKALSSRLQQPLLSALFGAGRLGGQSLMEVDASASWGSQLDMHTSQAGISGHAPEAFPSRNELLSKAKDDLAKLPGTLSRLSARLGKFWANKTLADQAMAELSPPQWFEAPSSPFNRSFGPDRVQERLSWPYSQLHELEKAYKGTHLSDILLLLTSRALNAYLLAVNQLPQTPLIALVDLNPEQTDSSYFAKVPTHIAHVGRALKFIRAQRNHLGHYAKIAPLLPALGLLPSRILGLGAKSYVKGRFHRFHQPAVNVLISIESQERRSATMPEAWSLVHESKFGELYPGVGLHLYFLVNEQEVSLGFSSTAAVIDEGRLLDAFIQAKEMVAQGLALESREGILANREFEAD